MKIIAIPTNYSGVQMRSRLEARWAALFDLYQLPWQYEPFDLDGWIPDFVIERIGQFPFFVDVKPWPQSHGGDVVEFERITAKINRAVGTSPKCVPAIFGTEPIFTWLRLEGAWTVTHVFEHGDEMWKRAGNAVQWKR